MATLRETIPLQKVKIVKKSLGGIMVVLGICGMISFFGQVYTLLWFVFVGFLVCLGPVWEYLYFNRYFYDIDEKNILIRKGILAQKEITLPFSRITDVYVDQDLLDFLFKIYDVHISTPTATSGMFAHIDGVNKEGSRQLRQMILDRINRAEIPADPEYGATDG